MRLQQDQIWQQAERYFRIVRLERLSVMYREMKDPTHKYGKDQTVTKKEFCRLIKGARLIFGQTEN